MDGTRELAGQIGAKPACDATGASRATLYRAEAPRRFGPRRPRPRPARALSAQEQRDVMDLLHTENFVDMAPRAIHGVLLEMGIYLCSARTMYRLLEASRETGERRQQARHDHYERPELLATAPNQVWTWDVTWLRGPERGERYALYIMLDLFSRYVVGWRLADAENGELAADFIDQCHASQGIAAGALTVHSDRGSAQRSENVVALTQLLDVARSYGRPRVSNDNAYSESINKTLKYRLDYPNRFSGLDDARAHCRRFFIWYNTEHRHSGIAMLTPEVVHAGTHEPIVAHRQATLDRAHAAHPERFVRGAPKTETLPTTVYLNKPLPKPEAVAH